MVKKVAQFRFYAELNDFLPKSKRQKSFPFPFQDKPLLKDAIESIGVPHPCVDLILANGVSVGFDYCLADRDIISIYPVFESLDISPIMRLRKRPLRKTKFIMDVHLDGLAKMLRRTGFDTLYKNNLQDDEIVRISKEEKRIILTRDQGLLKTKGITHGYCIRSTSPEDQFGEVLDRFDLYSQKLSFSDRVKVSEF